MHSLRVETVTWNHNNIYKIYKKATQSKRLKWHHNTSPYCDPFNVNNPR